MRRLVPYVIDVLVALVLTLGLLWPVTTVPGVGLQNGWQLAALLASQPGTTGWLPLVAAWGFLPLFALYRLAAFAFPRNWERFARPSRGLPSALRLVATALSVNGLLVPFFLWSGTPGWLASLPATAWGLLAVGAGANLWAVVGLVDRLNHRNPGFLRYREFSRRAGPSLDPAASALDRLFNIRAKLLTAFVGLITLILVVLSSVLLSNYEKTLLKAVADGARSQVEQATSVYKANLGDDSRSAIAMFDFLNAQARVNAKAAFPFRTFGFYTDLKGRYLVDQPSGAAPGLRAEYLTGFPDLRFPPAPGLKGSTVAAYLDPAASQGVRDPEARTVSYASPILKNEFEKRSDGTKVRHDLLLGLAVLTFDEDIILAPYVQTRTTVILLTLLFLYLAVILVFLVGNFIVHPLLFLRMNVRTVSDSLKTMVRGQSRVSAANLHFDGTVHTRDEIRSLSGEIGEMVTVIRGIIPYISASTLKQAEKGTALSQTKDLAFLFTDIRGFTSLCEGMKPDEVVGLLNRYLDLETEIILANGGDVDKFVGDEVMAFFDGPDKEFHACRAALQIRKAMFDEKALRQGQGLPAVDIGIGIHSGEVVFGSVGARDRMDFTSIGDTVNLAARLEGANKGYGSKTIVSEAVEKKVRDRFVCRELDLLAVKGKNEGVRIFEVLQEGDAAPAKVLTLAKTFRTGLEAYRSQDWDRAEAAFQSLVDHYGDAPAEVFLGRIRQFRAAPPPPDWDGIFRMDTK